MTRTAAEHWVLVVNGELPADRSSVLTDLLVGADRLVAVDGGLRHCATLDVWPAMVIGDLDSVSADLVQQARDRQVEFRTYPADKDATDLELALALAVESGAGSITVVAGFGGRLDHELATVSLLASNRWNTVVIRATDGQRELFIVRDAATLQLAVGSTLSLLPWHGATNGVTTQGLQWPLADATLAAGSTWGVSNVAVDPRQEVRIRDGVLVVVADPTTP